MRYVGGGAKVDGCLFCNQFAGSDDVASLVLWRGEHAFVTMNLFPYNTGHVMVVPNAHLASPEEADLATLAEMATLLQPLLTASRRVFACAGFNIGMNVGDVAGAGIAAHLHQHVVPRWVGDANFMPIIAGAMVLPELIPVTYAKLRAELVREHGEEAPVAIAVVGPEAQVLLDAEGRLPAVAPIAGQPLFRSAGDAVMARIGPAHLVGWAGSRHVDGQPSAFAYRSGASNEAVSQSGWRWSAIDQIAEERDQRIAEAAVAAAAGVVVAPG